MNIIEIIEKKKDNKELSLEELEYAFNGFLSGDVADYQMSSLLMAICINGMSFDETKNLTDIMVQSGVTIDTSKTEGILVDKHSTGGVGDDVTLVLGPILASIGLKVGKMSGRGLGITGGTIDKLSSIPGFRTSLTIDEFIHNINTVGLSISSQTPDITPLDKVVYALRDVSGTTSSIPLIASSIMSKKIAIGAEYILIDIKVGEGALIKNRGDALELANTMVKIGDAYNRVVIPVLTDMDNPLSDSIGNSLAILDVIDTLKGKRSALLDLSIHLSSILLTYSLNIDMKEAEDKVNEVLNNGSALKKFYEFVENQGGDLSKVSVSSKVDKILSSKSGTIESISAYKIGSTGVKLGAGRKKINDAIDYGVGIKLNVHVGDKVNTGDTLCYVYKNDDNDYSDELRGSFVIVN